MVVGTATGYLAGTIGVGGFIGVPAMIYVFGVPTAVATGTELFLAVFMGGYGALSYAYQGFVDLRLTMLLYLGSLVGIHLGVYGVKVVNEKYIRVVTSLIILLCVFSRVIAIPVYLRQLRCLNMDAGWDVYFNMTSKSFCSPVYQRCAGDPHAGHSCLPPATPNPEDAAGDPQAGSGSDRVGQGSVTVFFEQMQRPRNNQAFAKEEIMSYQCDILIVDDEPIVGERLKAFIKKDGHRVETFVEPSAALKRLEEKDFDIVISDIRMGEIDGIQVMQKVFQKSRRTKVIMITGYATLELARESLTKGAFDFIAKPFKLKEIRRTIEKAVESLEKSDPRKMREAVVG